MLHFIEILYDNLTICFSFEKIRALDYSLDKQWVALGLKA